MLAITYRITFCLPPSCLLPIWCLLDVGMKPMCFQGEEILPEPLNAPWALIGKHCHRRWEEGWSHTAKRIYYLGRRGALSQSVSTVSHLALSVSVEQSLLCAMREQLSSFILVAARSNAISSFFSLVSCYDGLYWKPKTFKGWSAAWCWSYILRINKNCHEFHPDPKNFENSVKPFHVELDWSFFTPWNRDRKRLQAHWDAAREGILLLISRANQILIFEEWSCDC